MMEAALRQFVWNRADSRCEYCHLPQSAIDLTFHVEHIIARQHGGDDSPDNLGLACDRCNFFKGPNLSSINRMTGEVVQLFHPRRQLCEEHFELQGFDIVGKTPIGQVTLELLKMNTSRRRELRAQLIEAGEFF
jgi:hypothetical protein